MKPELVQAVRELRDSLNLLIATHRAESKEREEDRHQLYKGDLWDDFVKAKRQNRGRNVGIAEGSAANPADKGTPAGHKQVGVLCFDLIDCKLPEDLLELPGSFKLGQFKFRLRGYRWVREYPVYQLADNGEEGEEGHYD